MEHPEMKITWAAVDDIQPDPNNPRGHEKPSVDAIAASIKAHGWKQVIAVNPQGVILAGEGRWLAAKQLGLSRVPVVYFNDLDEAGQRSYRLADNKTGELSYWIDEKLLAELLAIDVDMSAFGFPEHAELDIKDEDFLLDTEIVKQKKKTVCPVCGAEF